MMIPLVLAIILIAGCVSQQEVDYSAGSGAPEVQIASAQKSSDEGILEKVANAFASDAKKLEKEFQLINDENNETFFNSVGISKNDNTLKMEFVVTDNVTSKIILNVFTLEISVRTYGVTQDFDELNIIYLNTKNKQVGIMTIPKKAIKDVADYAKQTNNTNYLESPYAEAFWKVSTILYDSSVPELIPTSVFGNTNFGDDADEIAQALTKKVTHLKIICGSPDNWDADAENDGITWELVPLAADNTIVPIEGTFEAKTYERVPIEDSFNYEKGQLIYTRTATLEGTERLKYFRTWNGYHISLKWDEVKPFMASSSDNGMLYVTLTDKEGNVFSAKTGDGSYSDCQLREP